MVDQAQVTDGNGAAEHRGVAHNMAELLHDSLTLGELQLKLLKCDFDACLARIVWPSVFLLTAVVLLASCVPIALVTIALVLNETTALSAAQSFAITLGCGLLLGGVVGLVSAWFLRRCFATFRRSQAELEQNLRWIKRMFQRLGRAGSRREWEEPYVL
jgi:hypothetical protein